MLWVVDFKLCVFVLCFKWYYRKLYEREHKRAWRIASEPAVTLRSGCCLNEGGESGMVLSVLCSLHLGSKSDHHVTS